MEFDSGADAFAWIVSAADRPVYLVTAFDGRRRAGCLVGFATQASIDPARFLACLSVRNLTYRIAARSRRLAVHVIPRSEVDLVRLFAEETGDEIDKFAHCSWHDGPAGVPVLDAAAAWFAGPVVAHLPLGDHVGHLVAPEAGSVRAPEIGAAAPGPALVGSADVTDMSAGHPA